jgi:1-acyl-sn-glycerol-3-phosphate acyltransferase
MRQRPRMSQTRTGTDLRADRTRSCPLISQPVSYLWRLAGTGTSFLLFGLFGILLGAVVFPLLRLAPMSQERRRNLSVRLVCWSFRRFIGFMRGAGVLSYEFRGRERLGRPGQLIIANHPSLIDVVFLIAFTPLAGCVVKASMWRNPFTSGVASAAGYVRNAPTDEMIEGASSALQSNQALIMFPEGTRTTPGKGLEFHRGAASVAVRAARVLTPVFIRVEPLTLTKGQPWYRIPPRRPHFSLVVGEDIDISPFRANNPLPKAGRALNQFLIGRFSSHQPYN